MRDFLEKTGLVLLALFTGNNAKAQTWVEQIDQDNPFNLFEFSEDVRPQAVDLDNDGDLDIVSGACGEAWLVFLRNDGGGQYNQIAGIQNPLEGITGCSSPEFIDIDNDGDLDLFVGSYYQDKYARISLFENDGSGNFTPSNNNPFEGIDFDYVANPAFSDIDDDGDMDAVIGENYSLRIFNNNGDNTFTELDPANTSLADIEFFEDLTPEFGDIDLDGDEDIIFGNKYGNFITYEKTGPSTFVQLNGEVNPLDSIDNFVSPFPSLFDFEGDGDLDLLVGQATGKYAFYLNTSLSIGTNELAEIDLNIFPNPANDILQISSSERLDYVNIFSLEGRLILNKPFFNGNYFIDISQLEPGNYILRIAHNESFYTRKIVKI